MSGIEEIQSAEATIAKMQEALAAVQTGLERAETVAGAAEEAEEKSAQSAIPRFSIRSRI